jgi:hypothetical protein
MSLAAGVHRAVEAISTTARCAIDWFCPLNCGRSAGAAQLRMLFMGLAARSERSARILAIIMIGIGEHGEPPRLQGEEIRSYADVTFKFIAMQMLLFA